MTREFKLYTEFNGPATDLPMLDGQVAYAAKESVGIVFTAWECKDLTIRCLKSVLENSLGDPLLKGIVIVDNGSTDGTSEAILGLIRNIDHALQGAEIVYVRNGSNRYWSRAVNAGIRALPPCDIAVVINADCEPKSPQWLDYFRASMPDSQIWLAGYVDTDADMKGLQAKLSGSAYDGAQRTSAWLAAPGPKPRVQHWCFAARTRAYREIGLYLQDGAFTHYWSDLEFCARVRAHGGQFAHVLPDVHHWHQMGVIYREWPQQYWRLISDLQDPATEGEYLMTGRPLWESEQDPDQEATNDG